MKHFSLQIAAAAAALLMVAEVATAIPNRPAGARKFSAELVTAYNDCLSPNDATNNAFAPLNACTPAVQTVPSCGFVGNGKGKVKIKADIPAGDLRYKVKIKGLSAGCIGQQLDFIVKYQQTNNDCSIGSGECTAENREAAIGSCTVTASGNCSINTTANTGAGGTLFQPGLETSLSLHGCGLKLSGEVAFICGLLLD